MNIRLPPTQFPDLTDFQMAVAIGLLAILALLPALGAISVRWLSPDKK